MKAIQFTQPRTIQIIDTDAPAAPGPGQALVATHRVGICGTDLSGYLGKMPFFSYPRIPGHELGVEVLAVGEGVTEVKPGDRCSVEPYMNCGDCHACRKGASNCCANLKVIGVMTDGGLCERFLIRADKLHPSKSLSFDQLALVETLAIGCHAVDRGAPVKGEACLVIGAGPIGLATIVFARLTGARVVVLDMNADRLAFCRQVMRVDATVALADTVVTDLRRACGGELPDVIIDATGHSGSMSNAVGYLAPTGRLVYVGITTQQVAFTHTTLHKPEGTILASRNALPRDFARIIRLIETGEIDTVPWITHRTAFADLPANFESYTKPETGVIKAIVELP